MDCPHCQLKIPPRPETGGQPTVCPGCGKQLSVAGKAFDPYSTWLGIMPAEQPPHFYRLLGIQLFEPNPRAIEDGAQRQINLLETAQTSAHAAEAHRLINEVALARTCLLNPTHKAAYDFQLTATLAPQHVSQQLGMASRVAPSVPPAPPAPPSPPALATAPGAPAFTFPTRTSASRPPQPIARQKKSSSLVTTIGIVLGGLMGLSMGAMVVFYFTGMDVLGFSARDRQQAQTPTPPASDKARTQPDSPRKTQPKPGTETEKPQPAPLPASPSKTNEGADFKIRIDAPIPAAEPLRPTLLLANVPRATSLPQPTSAASATLFALTREADEPLSFAIHSDLANLPPSAAVTVDAQPDSGIWLIQYSDDSEALNKEEVASIHHDGRSLTFTWAPGADARIQRQLSNCLLEVRHAAESRIVQLRKIVMVDALDLDLDKGKQTMSIEIADLPPSGKTFLRIQELVGFTRGAKIRGGNRPIGVSRSAYIDFSDMAGPQLEFRFVGPAPRGLAVALDGIIDENGKKELDLSFTSLKKFNDTQEAALTKRHPQMAAAEAQQAAAKSNLERVKADPASKPAQISAAALAVQHWSKVRDDLNEPFATRLAAVPGVRSFMEELHQRAKIRFSICAMARDKEIVLAESN